LRSNKSVSLIIVAVFSIIILLAQNNIDKAFAVTLTIITTTGTQTNDNCQITTSNHGGTDSQDLVWLLCGATSGSANPTLSVLNKNGTQLATLATTFANLLNDGIKLIPLYNNADIDSILVKHVDDYIKYHYSAGAITQVGTFTAGCVNSLIQTPAYDSLGFLWYTCNTVHKIGAFNPNTMTSKYLSNALNGLTPSCQAPSKIAIDRQTSLSTSFYVFLVCSTNNELFIGTVSNSGTTYSSVTALAASFAHTAFTNTQLFVDEVNNRIVVSKTTGTGLTTYTYTGNGLTNPVVTSENTDVGNDINQQCYGVMNQVSVNTDNSTLYCVGTNVIQGFASTPTSFTAEYNNAEFTTTFTQSYSMLSTVFGSSYVVGQGTVNNAAQKFAIVGSASSIGGGPTPPAPPAPPSNTGGVDCTDPQFSYRLICNMSGNSGLTGASNLLNQSGTNILCQIGLLACTQGSDGNFTANNSNIKTNGVGYLLVAIAIAIFVGILWVASRGQLTEIPTFVWFIGTIAIVGTITAFGWIDPTFLIITIITIVAFAVAKARGVFGGQTVFAGE